MPPRIDLRLVAHARGDAELERWGLRRKAELLERVLGRTIECVLDEHHKHGPPAAAPARVAAVRPGENCQMGRSARMCGRSGARA